MEDDPGMRKKACEIYKHWIQVGWSLFCVYRIVSESYCGSNG